MHTSSVDLQYQEYDKELCNLLDGMFSFVLLDESVTPSRIIAARDPIGITTLYQGWDSQRPSATFFASELKALTTLCDKIISFPPGHVYDSRDQSTTHYFHPSWWNGDAEGANATIPDTPADLKRLRETLEEAVRKRLMSEVPYGVLLSGGLDSSLIASIAARETEKVAQAQAEARRRRLQEARRGPPTPGEGDGVDEARAYCSSLSSSRAVVDLSHSTPCGAFQRPSWPGPSCTRSLSVWRTRPTCWRRGKRRIIWAPCTMNIPSLCRKA